MAYLDTDGLYRKYGTEKAVVTTGGEYRNPGALRSTEFTIDLTKLTATRAIINDVTFMGAGMFIEEVEVVADALAAGGTSFSVGLMAYDRSTVLSDTAFVNGALLATVDTVGEKTVLTKGSTGAGAYIGTTLATPGYVTALASGTFTTGSVKVRIKWRGIGTITQ